MKYAAVWLSVLCVVVFVLQAVFGTELFLLINQLKWSEPWRLLLSVFAHSDSAHLLSNLFALMLFGLVLEGMVGAGKVFWLFIVSGVLVNVLSPYPSSLGASGAIYAIIGALAVLRPFMVIYVQWLPMPMVLAAFVYLLQDIFGVFYPSGVGNLAHISGLFIGFSAGFFWRRRFGDAFHFSRKSRKSRVIEQRLDKWERRYMGGKGIGKSVDSK